MVVDVEEDEDDSELDEAFRFFEDEVRTPTPSSNNLLPLLVSPFCTTVATRLLICAVPGVILFNSDESILPSNFSLFATSFKLVSSLLW